MGKDLVRISRFLSLVLRHDPGRIGLELDREGWASVADLVEGARLAGLNLTVELVREVVATSDKRRFSLSETVFITKLLNQTRNACLLVGRRVQASQVAANAVGSRLDLPLKKDLLVVAFGGGGNCW